VNEDFAVESMAGDIFQLGNASWRILRVERGTVRVEDAHGQPPTVPFWLGEAPARTPELSAAVGALRDRCEGVLSAGQDLAAFLESDCELNPSAAHQLADYLSSAWSSLGALPGQQTVIAERFFDEAGGMQLVLHSPRGTRVNRAWGLALRKRFCRTFNFELQAAATEDAIVLSLGPQHSFPLDDVFHFLASKTARDVLIQALLDAPMFTLRWRWNAARSLAVARRRGGRKVPPPLQRMEAEDLIAAVFPDQLACLENIVGDREVPDHPLVHQTIQDCLKEAMDVEALLALLRGIEDGEVRCIARDLPEPSVLAQEVLNAKPYAFLDDAPLEERRTQAVYQRRSLGPSAASELGALDREAIERVRAEAWPQAENPDEAHDALLILGLLREDEGAAGHEGQSWTPFLERLREERRAGLVALGPARFWVAAERLRQVLAARPEAVVPAGLAAPERGPDEAWTPESAMKEVVRGRLECTGPITARALAERIASPSSGVEGALLALEAEGCILRGRFTPGESELEWCDRRLLARIHRLTLNRLRAEIEPVSAAELLRFLVVWQGLEPETQRKGPEGLRSVIEMLDGFEVPAVAWEADVLAARVDEYDPIWLDGLCLSGDVAWGRRPRGEPGTGKISAGPIRSTPIALFLREHSAAWLPSIALAESFEGSAAARQVLDALARQGASFFADIVRRSALLRSQVADALGELAAAGLVTSDSFAGLRSLLRPERQRGRAYRAGNRRRSGSLETAGRWSLRGGDPDAGEAAATGTHDTRLEVQARALLRRWGVVFRRILERESAPAPWRDLARVYRRWEARGELRGGRFVEGFTGEQFALPEAVGLLRSLRRQPPRHARIAISAADPLNLAGIVTPGDRVPSIASHRVLLDDGVPVASLEAGRLRRLLPADATTPERSLRDALLRRRLPPELRALY